MRGARRGRGRPARACRGPRVRAATRLTSAAAWICSIESRNLAATSTEPSAPRCSCSHADRAARRTTGTAARRAAPCGRSAPAPRRGCARSARSEPRRLSICSSRRARSAGLRSSRPSKHSNACSSAAASVASASASGRSRSRTSIRTSGAPAAVATIAGASGPHTTSGRCVSDCSERATSATASSRPVMPGCGCDAPQRDRRAGLEQPRARAEHERRQAVGELDRAVGERHRRIGDEQPDRAERQQPGVGGEAGEHVARSRRRRRPAGSPPGAG